MKRPLSEIIMDLAHGKEVVVEQKSDGTPIIEIFIEEGQFKKNELKRPGTEDPYDQDTIKDHVALGYLQWITE